MVSVVHEPPGRYDVIIRIARDGGQLPDPVTFAVAADQAASRRSASIISVHMADTIINVVTVTAPGRDAALAVARAVVSDALKLRAPSPTRLGSDAPVVERRIEHCLFKLAAADGPCRDSANPKIGELLGARQRPAERQRSRVQGTGGSGGWFEGDLVAEGFELADVSLLAAFGVDAGVVVVAAEVGVAGAGV